MRYISPVPERSAKIRLSLLHFVELHLHLALNHSQPSTLILPQFSLSVFHIPYFLSILTYLFPSTSHTLRFHLMSTLLHTVTLYDSLTLPKSFSTARQPYLRCGEGTAWLV